MNRARTGAVFLQMMAICLICCSNAYAHKPSDSYLKISGGGSLLTVQWDIALKDLDFLIGLDADQNGEITWGEVKQNREKIASLALNHLSISAEATTCDLQLNELLINRHSDGAYAVLDLATDQPGDARKLTINYSLLFDVDPTHRGLVLYSNDATGTQSTHIISPSDPPLTFDTAQSGMIGTLLEYIREGVWHIWIGFDHILFLISLLLPAVFIRKDKKWETVDAFRPACGAVLKIVTVFTIAHSITLWLAVMEYVQLPAGFVEATIAFSIVVTALNNLYPVLPLSGWAIAFVFGLIHGFGFANVLVDLGLSSVALAISLLGFNVGVELGQIAIVLVFLPIAFLMRDTIVYRVVVFKFGSLLIAGIALIWMYERICDVEILGF